MHPRSVGGYDKEEKAARAYDLAALKYWGTTTTTNFPVSSKKKKKRILKHFTYFCFCGAKSAQCRHLYSHALMHLFIALVFEFGESVLQRVSSIHN